LSPSLRILALFCWISLAACNHREPTVILDCRDFEALPQLRLDLPAAQEAYRRAEQRRNLRYQEAIDPGYFVRVSRELVEQGKIDRGRVCYEQLFTVGRLLFEHEYGFADGLGRDDAKTRPDPFRKVHQGHLGGPETNTCRSCHWRGGPAGAGALQDNSQLFGDGTNITSADARNPPALQGSGVAQILAREMSRDLQAQRKKAIKEAKDRSKAVRVKLRSKGVSFGYLAVSASGVVDNAELEGVDADLVIKPFGWRGTFETIRDFVAVSTQVHLGIQSEDLLAKTAAKDRETHLGSGPKNDPDNDGMTGELSAGQVTSIVVYLAGLEMPIIASPEALHEFPAPAEGVRAPPAHHFYDRFTEGQRLFEDIGCALCHTPMMILEDPVFRTTSEVTGKTYSVDLSKAGEEPRLRYNAALGGYPVWTFSDMKRHDLGPGAAGKHADPGLGDSEYLTRRLWGLAGSPPYFYDGRAPTVDVAIFAHGGEGSFARDEFAELTSVEKGSLRLFLLSLRRSPRLVVP
jgi:hypothetical protein